MDNNYRLAKKLYTKGQHNASLHILAQTPAQQARVPQASEKPDQPAESESSERKQLMTLAKQLGGPALVNLIEQHFRTQKPVAEAADQEDVDLTSSEAIPMA